VAGPTNPDENPGYKTKKKGVRRPRWRNGYIEEWCPVRKRYVYQHRLVVEQRIGRFLLPSEIVHHENGVKTDNSDANLHLMTRSEHGSEHLGQSSWGSTGPRPWQEKALVPCPVCGTPFKPKRRTVRPGQQADTKTCSQSCGQVQRHR
jgi:hypothetical protein